MERITEKEWKEMMTLLVNSKMYPMLADTPVHYFDAGVHAGDPTDMGDSTLGEYLMFPKELLGMQPEFFVPVVGDSMKDAGIMEGDQLRIKAGVQIYDGDTVVVSINGDCTVKAYCVDEQGNQWLVPRNDAYSPIQLTEDMEIRFIGKVIGHLKEGPRTSYHEMMKAINRSRAKDAAEQKPDAGRIDSILVEMSYSVKQKRQWYAVYRPMVDRGVWGEGEYGEFCKRLAALLPNYEHLPVASELRRMCTQSFRKSVALWDPAKAPVSGQRFDDYLHIANLTREKLRK